jgi:hypothetical protein
MINAINNVIKANCRSMLTTVYTYFDGGTSALLDDSKFTKFNLSLLCYGNVTPLPCGH